MKKAAILLGCVLSALPTPTAIAYVTGGTNFSYSGYPDPECSRPFRPIKPYDLTNELAVDSYNRRVRLYNLEYDEYIACIQLYVENATNDMKRIKEKAEEEIQKARPEF